MPDSLYLGQPCPFCERAIRALVRVGPNLVADPCGHALLRLAYLDANGEYPRPARGPYRKPMPDDAKAPQVAHGPLVDGLPLCHSCFTGHHACTDDECSCQTLVCLLDQLRDRFALVPTHVWINPRAVTPPAK